MGQRTPRRVRAQRSLTRNLKSLKAIKNSHKSPTTVQETFKSQRAIQEFESILPPHSPKESERIEKSFPDRFDRAVRTHLARQSLEP